MLQIVQHIHIGLCQYLRIIIGSVGYILIIPDPIGTRNLPQTVALTICLHAAGKIQGINHRIHNRLSSDTRQLIIQKIIVKGRIVCYQNTVANKVQNFINTVRKRFRIFHMLLGNSGQLCRKGR